MKSKELKTYNLPNETAPLSEINAKPTWAFIVLIILGIVFIVIRLSAIYGVAMIIVGSVCICFMPRVTLMEFYYDYLVMYNRADKSSCVIIYYDEVASWYYAWGATKDYLVIELADGNSEKMEAFSKRLFEAHMSRYLRDKHKKTK